MSILRAKRFSPKSCTLLVLSLFILLHLLIDYLQNIEVPAVKSLKEISEDLATIKDDDPKLLKYVQPQLQHNHQRCCLSHRHGLLTPLCVLLMQRSAIVVPSEPLSAVRQDLNSGHFLFFVGHRPRLQPSR